MDLHESKYNMYHAKLFYSCEKLPGWGQLLHTVMQWGGLTAKHTRVVPTNGSMTRPSLVTQRKYVSFQMMHPLLQYFKSI